MKNLGLAFLAISYLAGPAAAQTAAPLLIAESNKIDIRDGDQLKKAAWTLTEGINPDIYQVPLDRKASREICFLSGSNTLCRTIRADEKYDFTISYGGKTYPTRIEGVYRPPMAVFDAAYQAAHRGDIRVDIPEVYELVNVAIALTGRAAEQDGLVYKDSPYFAEVQRAFVPVKDHPFVKALDEQMRSSLWQYFHLKMNGYAFVYGAGGRIERSPVYDRTSFIGRPSNDLLPFLAQMQDFSDKSGFRAFYAAHWPFYRSQIDYYRGDINLAAMQDWLKGNFPGVKPYDSVNILFSPLVSGMQSVTWIETNGFRELQPHVNFPYLRADYAGLSEKALPVRRGYIVFTEINHGFVNPAADNYRDRIAAALSNRARWARPHSPSDSYNDPYGLFTEYMNWGLVSLYVLDKAPVADRARMIADLDPYMAEKRGFPGFPAFNAFLVDLYRNRPAGATIEALYPRIIDWFATHNGEMPSPS